MIYVHIKQPYGRKSYWVSAGWNDFQLLQVALVIHGSTFYNELKIISEMENSHHFKLHSKIISLYHFKDKKKFDGSFHCCTVCMRNNGVRVVEI